MPETPTFVTLSAYTPHPVTGEEIKIEIEVRSPSDIPAQNVIHCIADATSSQSLAAIWNACSGEAISADRMALVMAQWDIGRSAPMALGYADDDD